MTRRLPAWEGRFHSCPGGRHWGAQRRWRLAVDNFAGRARLGAAVPPLASVNASAVACLGNRQAACALRTAPIRSGSLLRFQDAMP